MRQFALPAKQGLVVLACLWLTACAGGITQDPDFYLLTPTAPTSASARSTLLLSLKQVELPKYLDSSRIMTLHGENQLQQAAAHLWAEPLEENLVRVLAADLAARLGQDRVYIYPRPQESSADVTIDVVVEEFLGSTDKGVYLRAHWDLSRHNGKLLHRATSTIQESVPGPQYYDLVTAMSKSVGRLADDIAAALSKIRRN